MTVRKSGGIGRGGIEWDGFSEKRFCIRMTFSLFDRTLDSLIELDGIILHLRSLSLGAQAASTQYRMRD